MGKLSWSREKVASRKSVKVVLFSLTILCTAGISGFAYVHFFTKGLENLPSRVCDGTVERDLVIQVLPPARSADQWTDRQNSRADLTYYCHVTTTNNSSLLSETRVRPISKADWLKSYSKNGGTNKIIHTTADDIEALTQLNSDYVEVYAPCSPPSIPSYNASEDYAVLTRLWVDGDTKATGTPLGQALTDIAYQVTKHVHKLAECQGAHDFPQELPRYGDR
ncbi:hypothetical protein [Streptomyces prunicolor]|uniref:hypothetical protein n=1 Tax=Streptomyces prunicolor TaxID=67348 RepID=UPI00131A0FBE|nr:hypothetical protein [Streptomyces prunicolor]